MCKVRSPAPAPATHYMLAEAAAIAISCIGHPFNPDDPQPYEACFAFFRNHFTKVGTNWVSTPPRWRCC